MIDVDKFDWEITGFPNTWDKIRTIYTIIFKIKGMRRRLLWLAMR